MKYGIVYVVINEDEVVFASVDRDEAKNYADNRGYEAREAVLAEWGNDDPSEEDIAEADFQAGFDGDYYEVEKINISNKKEDDTVETESGMEIDVLDILEKLK